MKLREERRGKDKMKRGRRVNYAKIEKRGKKEGRRGEAEGKRRGSGVHYEEGLSVTGRGEESLGRKCGERKRKTLETEGKLGRRVGVPEKKVSYMNKGKVGRGKEEGGKREGRGETGNQVRCRS